jgi:hypothetical protein
MTRASTVMRAMAGSRGSSDGGMCGDGRDDAPGSNRSRRTSAAAIRASTTARRWRRVPRARSRWAPTSVVAIRATPAVPRAARESACGGWSWERSRRDRPSGFSLSASGSVENSGCGSDPTSLSMTYLQLGSRGSPRLPETAEPRSPGRVSASACAVRVHPPPCSEMKRETSPKTRWNYLVAAVPKQWS